MTIRVLLADDHALFRRALRGMLEMDADLAIVAEADNGEDVLAAVGPGKADIVCMDISMHGLGGIETTRRLLAAHPEVRVIGLSAHGDPMQVAAMLGAGALAYVLKEHAGRDLPAAIASVRRNEAYLSREVAAMLPGDRQAAPTTALNSRERQVLQLLRKGYDSERIAGDLGMVPATVAAHRLNLMRKLGISDDCDLRN